MPNYAIKIEYDGRPYHGWQRQRDVPSVQGTIEDALSKICPTPVEIQGAGRTDKGVHALGQVAHVHLDKEWQPFRLNEALNFHLRPAPISITACAQVDNDFHARFGAIERRYVFRLVSRRAPVVVDAGWVWQVAYGLDIDKMRAGAAHLIGKHDFTTFRSSICQAQSPVKSLDELSIEEIPSRTGIEYRFTIRARSFLHNQVRSFVGTLERVGAGAWHPDQVREALDAKERAACGPVCPGHGLYLDEVIYQTDPFAGP
ncbi:tRNA pseudouridine synthase A [Amylibacter marinus]|uniref:tRNA pseudouridine synthase A n=1 Tax=Amylibacter marinus TaxID=1475483 RepID=A0ABQ5VYD4_9RHOB|nr:tRNA pseudouridine(38-40) synthase TruA [Amylibacter marinus]GLQ36103.1 tRNA pseudouridine synthase A [Amylibacter marinus]